VKQVVDVLPCDEDAHFAFICERDAARSLDRADCMKQALLQARRDGAAKVELTLVVVSGWHALLSGEPPNRHNPSQIRRTDAYAKQGRERYPYSDNLECEFIDCLSDADRESLSPALRAVCLYLDICFFHPFDDGNGRLARLALDFVLTKAGLCVRDVSGLFSITRRADDAIGAKAFVETIQEYLAPVGARRDEALELWGRDHAFAPSDAYDCNVDQRLRYKWFDCLTDIAFIDDE